MSKGLEQVAAPESLGRFAEMALACLHREYPHHFVHLVRGDQDVLPPRAVSPAFHGCFDWHSAVHGHWCLVRVLRCAPHAPVAARARAALGESLTTERIAGELRTLSAPERQGFERPYGLAWLLQLGAELRGWPDPIAGAWVRALEPLESLAAQRMGEWLPKLRWPVRSGEHSQTAFALGLTLDWARIAEDRDLARLIRSRALDFYGKDAGAPLAYEPSGHDFLSPILGEADLMRRVLAPGEFARWLDHFIPDLGSEAATRWLAPVSSGDPADGKLAHLDGLNLSRAWMLEGIAEALPRDHALRPALEHAAARHRDIGLGSVTGEHYAGAHWLGSFAVYLMTRRGVT